MRGNVNKISLEDKSRRFFGIESDCHSCVINQAITAASFAGLDQNQTSRVIAVAEEGLKKSLKEQLLVQHIIRYIADAIIEELGESPDFDIYAGVKRESNRLSINCSDLLQKKIDDSQFPLETGLQIAAAGNIIDFGAKNHTNLNLVEELEKLTTILFTRYDLEPFKKALSDASTMLYICDNCGEIVFDMLFMKQLMRDYPDLKIIAAVRDKPIINDATFEDASYVGLDRLVTVISSGSVYPGTILSESTEEFKALFESSSLILAKGQGNLETLLPLSNERLFFLLRIKCEFMANLTGVSKDSLALIHNAHQQIPNSTKARLK